MSNKNDCQKALRELSYLEEYKNRYIYNKQQSDLMIQVARECIKKEIPLAPQLDTNRKDIFCCPSCGSPQGFGDLKDLEDVERLVPIYQKHCQICGQKYDWENFNFKEVEIGDDMSREKRT